MEIRLVLLVVLSAYAIVIYALTKKFKVHARYVMVFLAPLSFFTLGYQLRLSGIQESMDLGFFLTDSSYLFVYVLFAFFLLLGQLRYWRKA